MSVLVKKSHVGDFEITIGRNNPSTNLHSLTNKKLQSGKLNLAKLNQTITQGRSFSQNTFQAINPNPTDAHKHYSLPSSSSGPGPCLNYFSRTYGPKFDNKNVGNNFLGMQKFKKQQQCERQKLAFQSFDQPQMSLNGVKSHIGNQKMAIKASLELAKKMKFKKNLDKRNGKGIYSNIFEKRNTTVHLHDQSVGSSLIVTPQQETNPHWSNVVSFDIAPARENQEWGNVITSNLNTCQTQVNLTQQSEQVVHFDSSEPFSLQIQAIKGVSKPKVKKPKMDYNQASQKYLEIMSKKKTFKQSSTLFLGQREVLNSDLIIPVVETVLVPYDETEFFYPSNGTAMESQRSNTKSPLAMKINVITKPSPLVQIERTEPDDEESDTQIPTTMSKQYQTMNHFNFRQFDQKRYSQDNNLSKKIDKPELVYGYSTKKNKFHKLEKIKMFDPNNIIIRKSVPFQQDSFWNEKQNQLCQVRNYSLPNVHGSTGALMSKVRREQQFEMVQPVPTRVHRWENIQTQKIRNHYSSVYNN